MTKLLLATYLKFRPTKVDYLTANGEKLPFASNVTAILSPGHCAGQLALLSGRPGGLLFAADVCINRGRLQLTASVEDLETTLRSLAKLSAFSFDVACFGHGPPIVKKASLALRGKCPSAEAESVPPAV